MRFIKMHGLGNDYVYVNCFQEKLPADPAALAIAISDRHFGVGSDGLILVVPSERGDARMRMFNADGSESEMCGNGLRCVAKLVHDHGIARKPRLKLETGRGVLTVDLEIKNDKVERVRVDMGEPILEAASIPTTFPGVKVVNELLRAGGREFVATCVSMGNPHCVIFENENQSGLLDVREGVDPVAVYGPLLENDVHFPRRINVHFVRVHSRNEVTMRTWERGSGITLACGTGACAVAVAGVLGGLTDRKIDAHLPGGDLELEWNPDGDHVFMTGPAVEVFQGEWPAS